MNFDYIFGANQIVEVQLVIGNNLIRKKLFLRILFEVMSIAIRLLTTNSIWFKEDVKNTNYLPFFEHCIQTKFNLANKVSYGYWHLIKKKFGITYLNIFLDKPYFTKL